ncbi:MAG: NAD(P)/FAD-dependent oxidoreductase, partial [Acidimicrobiales bacterium]
MGPGTSDYDAVVIGAGVIGSAVSYELARRGHRTLSIDKLPASGFGSTSNSCAIVRFSYSTYEGVAMSYEGLQYWLDWPNYIGVNDPRGLVSFKQCGTMLVKREGGHHEKVVPLMKSLGIPFEDWDVETMQHRAPILDAGMYGPPKRPEDSAFWDDPTEQILGGIFTPESGYVSDPQLSAHNLQVAAEARGAEFRFGTEVVRINQVDGRVGGVTLADGAEVTSPIVVNVAGPHSYLINQLAGVYDSMNIKTQALRHEVHHVPAPSDFDWEGRGFHVQDGDTGVYFRPEVGNHMLIGSEDPECDPQEWVNPDEFNATVTDAQF